MWFSIDSHIPDQLQQHVTTKLGHQKSQECCLDATRDGRCQICGYCQVLPEADHPLYGITFDGMLCEQLPWWDALCAATLDQSSQKLIMLCEQLHLGRCFVSSYMWWHALWAAALDQMLCEEPRHDTSIGQNCFIQIWNRAATASTFYLGGYAANINIVSQCIFDWWKLPARLRSKRLKGKWRRLCFTDSRLCSRL